MSNLHRHNKRVYAELKPGDLLEIQHGRYPHWAVFIGNDDVVHLSGQRTSSVVVSKFWDLVKGHKVYINNGKDRYLKPFSQTEIKDRALSTSGSVHCGFYTDHCSYSPSFISHHQEQLQLCDLQVRWHNYNIYLDLQIGDLIHISHANGVCSHWAVYIGDGKVVHKTSNFLSTTHIQIQEDDLCTVIQKGRVEVNNDKDTRFKPYSSSETKERALSKVGEAVYNVMTDNSEHFVTWCRYGDAHSNEAERLLADPMAQTLLPSGDGESQYELGEPVTIKVGWSSHPGVYIGNNKAVPLSHVEEEVHWRLVKGLKEKYTPRSRRSSQDFVSTKLTMYCEHYASWCRYGTEQSDKFYTQSRFHVADHSSLKEGKVSPLADHLSLKERKVSPLADHLSMKERKVSPLASREPNGT